MPAIYGQIRNSIADLSSFFGNVRRLNLKISETKWQQMGVFVVN